MNETIIFSCLSGLAANNNREWHRGRKEQMGCKGCAHIDKPFWGDSGKPVEQCKCWAEGR